MGIIDKLKSVFAKRHIQKEYQPVFDSDTYVSKLSAEDRALVAKGISSTLIDQRNNVVKRGFYWETQIAFAYNSNKIEGSMLTKDDTRAIFETKSTVGSVKNIDDVQEMRNHFRMFDYMLDTLHEPLTEDLLKRLHGILKNGLYYTPDGVDVTPGDWKTLPNGVSDLDTVPPKMVSAAIENLLRAYSAHAAIGYEEIADFHVRFERIHPLQDGNGRVGRMIAFRECLRNNLVPFVVIDSRKDAYYESLKHYKDNPQMLSDYFKDMAEGYYREFANLIPESFLLGHFERFQSEEVKSLIEGEFAHAAMDGMPTERTEKLSRPFRSARRAVHADIANAESQAEMMKVTSEAPAPNRTARNGTIR